MIGLSSFVFLIAVTLNAYPETMNVGDIAFAVNFIPIFSVLFMAVGIYIAFSSKRMLRKTYRRGHTFETPGRIGRRGAE